ncbi:MAG: hypothetical protein ABIG63_20290, partial [Chloroflexota bacterium]
MASSSMYSASLDIGKVSGVNPSIRNWNSFTFLSPAITGLLLLMSPDTSDSSWAWVCQVYNHEII